MGNEQTSRSAGIFLTGDCSSWRYSPRRALFPTAPPRQRHASPPPEYSPGHISRANGKESLRVAHPTPATGTCRAHCLCPCFATPTPTSCDTCADVLQHLYRYLGKHKQHHERGASTSFNKKAPIRTTSQWAINDLLPTKHQPTENKKSPTFQLSFFCAGEGTRTPTPLGTRS